MSNYPPHGYPPSGPYGQAPVYGGSPQNHGHPHGAYPPPPGPPGYSTSTLGAPSPHGRPSSSHSGHGPDPYHGRHPDYDAPPTGPGAYADPPHERGRTSGDHGAEKGFGASVIGAAGVSPSFYFVGVN
ncbi:MAG: hypothetical protein M1838_006272 [Thelocarpon superellum]|nr:MAG: hypothetical protein M1838_006272 [Thelocarpon superellum]